MREEGKIQVFRSGTGSDGVNRRLKAYTKTFRREGSTKKAAEHFCSAAPEVRPAWTFLTGKRPCYSFLPPLAGEGRKSWYLIPYFLIL